MQTARGIKKLVIAAAGTSLVFNKSEIEECLFNIVKEIRNE